MSAKQDPSASNSRIPKDAPSDPNLHDDSAARASADKSITESRAPDQILKPSERRALKQ
jgi:hypothetical protein